MQRLGTVLLLGLVAATGRLHAQSVPPSELVRQLGGGGYVLVMRHASSPREPPSAALANPDNRALERQLDEAGQRGAAAMGMAIRALKIPVGEVLTSPTYRAVETLSHAGFTSPTVVTELGDRGRSMQGIDEAQAAWLRKKVNDTPRSGNMLIVTHQPNLSRAFPEWGATVADGEVVVLRPNGQGDSAIVGRIPIGAWSSLR
jgi:phosphohistidine phosphatase SixA